MKHKPLEQHGNADGLSRSPLEFDKEWTEVTGSEGTVCLLEEQQLTKLPIKVPDICIATAQDPILSKVYNFRMRGWSNSSSAVPNNLKPFYKHRLNLSVFKGCLLLASGWSSQRSIIHLY